MTTQCPVLMKMGTLALKPLVLLFSLQEVKQKLNGEDGLSHFMSAVGVVVKRGGLDSAKVQLLF